MVIYIKLLMMLGMILISWLDTILQYDHVKETFEVLPQTLSNGSDYSSAVPVERSRFPSCG
jgi:hypothetical protein